jgi:hypothetical protein
MAFGDRKYDSAEPNSFYTSHAHAGVTFLLGNSLRQAYFAAQARGQVLLQQPYPFNTQDLQGDLSSARSFLGSATVYTGIARGWCLVPRETTHLVAEMFFAVQTLAACQVSHKLTCRNGAGCDTSTGTLEISEVDNIAGYEFAYTHNDSVNARLQRFIASDFPYVGPVQVRSHKIDLALVNVVTSAPGNCQIRVEALANRTTDGASFGAVVPYQPLWIQVSREMRY